MRPVLSRLTLAAGLALALAAPAAGPAPPAARAHNHVNPPRDIVTRAGGPTVWAMATSAMSRARTSVPTTFPVEAFTKSTPLAPWTTASRASGDSST